MFKFWRTLETSLLLMLNRLWSAHDIERFELHRPLHRFADRIEALVVVTCLIIEGARDLNLLSLTDGVDKLSRGCHHDVLPDDHRFAVDGYRFFECAELHNDSWRIWCRKRAKVRT